MLRTLYNEPDRYVSTYWSEYDEETYFAGDGARIDEDGYFWVVGRIDDVLNVAGHRLSTMEEAIVIGTREALAERVDQDVDPEAVDLHKGTVDDLTITENGRTYSRVPDVFDVWLDSSVASWGTLGYPSDEDTFEDLWPADLIMEAHDQTRGWFWSQLGMGTAAMNQVPYEEVLMHGHALMPDGRAMSKSKNITVEPGEVMDEYGADPMRLFLLSVTPQGDDMRFSWESTETMQRDLNILWNAFRFPLPYMAMDDVDPLDLDVTKQSLERIDRWLLSRLQAVEATAADAWDDFEQHRALDAILDFVVEDVSRYYIQVVRERMWEAEQSDSKLAAYATLVTVLQEVIALLAPYAPFITEELYQRLTEGDGLTSVHMLDWPEPADTLRDESLEAGIEVVREIEEAGSRARQDAGRKLRWPVTRIVVDATTEAVGEALADHDDLLAERLNARRIEVVEPGGDWEELQYTATADMSELGPAFGDQAHAVMEALNDARVAEPDLQALEDAVSTDLGESITLEASMVSIEAVPPESVAGAEFEGGTVYVDTALTRDVESEGYAREIIRRAQEMRKDLELDMDARVHLEIVVYDERVGKLVADHEDMIAEEVRADTIDTVEDGYQESWTVEGTDVELAIDPVD